MFYKLNILPIFAFICIFVFFSACGTKKQLAKLPKKEPDKELSMVEKLKIQEYLIDGSKQKMLGNTDKAIAYFTKAVDIDKNCSAALYEIARLTYLYQDINGAIELMEKVVKIDEKNQWYHIFLADLYFKVKRLDEGIRVSEKLVELFPEKTDYKYNLANIYIQHNKNQKALKVLQMIEDEIGVTEVVSLSKSRIYMELDIEDKVYTELNKLINSFPDEYKYQGMLAEYYTTKKKFDKAYNLYQEMLKASPDNGLLHYSFANFYKITGKYEKAYEELKKIMNHYNVDIQTKARIWIQNSSQTWLDETQSEELLAILSKQYPADLTIKTLEADFYLNQGKFEKARTIFLEVLEKDKSSFIVWEQVLNLHMQLNDYKKLLHDSDRALEYFPNQPVLYFFKGIGAYYTEQYALSVKTLEEGLDLFISSKKLEAQFFIFIGEAYNKLKKYEKSNSAFDKALDLEPNNKPILNNYSYYLSLRSDSLNKALGLIQRCVYLEPENPTYLDTYAWVLYKLKRYEEALIHIEKAIRSGGGGNATIVEHFGDILFQNKKQKQALEQWKKSYELDDSNDELKQKIKLKKLLNDAKKSKP